jgi:hypothetical protein
VRRRNFFQIIAAALIGTRLPAKAAKKYPIDSSGTIPPVTSISAAYVLDSGDWIYIAPVTSGSYSKTSSNAITITT